MRPSLSPPIAAPPYDPVRFALGDPVLQTRLERQATAFFQRHLAARPKSTQLEEAEDAVQETRKRALEKQSKFDPAKGEAAGWIHGILKVVCCEQCHKLKVRLGRLPDESSAWNSLEARLDPDRDPTELTVLLDELNEEDRRIVTWHYLDELSHHAIAEKLGISKGASRVRLSRALTQLKRIANEKEGVR